VTLNEEWTFAQPGKVLKWKAVLTGDGVSKLPEIDQIDLSYKTKDYTSSGYVVSSLIQPLEVGDWDRIVVNQNLNGGSIKYQVLDKNGNLIPDSELSGNSSGLTPNSQGEIDLSSINAYNPNYSALYLKAIFNSANEFSTPIIDGWQVKWIKAKGLVNGQSSSLTINLGSQITFDASPAVGESLTYLWDFDSSNGINWDNPDATGMTASYTYPKIGTYTATLRVKQGSQTAIDDKTFTIAVTGGSGGVSETPVPSSLVLTLNPTHLKADGQSTAQLSALVKDQFGNLIANGTQVNWSILSGSGSISPVQSQTTNGLASATYTAGTIAGSVKIQACTLNNKCDEEILTLEPSTEEPVLTSLTISPKTAELKIGQTLQFTVLAKDQFGNQITGLTFNWSSSNSSIAEISQNGLLTAKKKGEVIVTVSKNGIQDTASVKIIEKEKPVIPPEDKSKEEKKEEEVLPEEELPPGEQPGQPPEEQFGGPTEEQPSVTGPREEKGPIEQITEKIVSPGFVQGAIKIKEFVQKEIYQNPIVQKINKRVVLPAALVVAVANTVSSVATSALSFWAVFQYLLQILKYLFTQPAYLLARKRKSWGTVYDSITKEPIGLAIVRLYQQTAFGKKLIQTKVTGPDGRYFFLIPSADRRGLNADLTRTDVDNYIIEVTHADYIFPSKRLAGQSKDQIYENLYFGQPILRQGVINFNIPLDLKEGKVSLIGFNRRIISPIRTLQELISKPKDEKEKEYRRILKEVRVRKISKSIALIAPMIALLNFVVSPGYLTFVILLIHFSVYFFFKHLALKYQPTPWGLSKEKISGQVLPKTLIRLFESQFGKQIALHITDQQGRYGFLVGPGKYYLTAEKPKYILPEGKIEIEGEKEILVKRDIEMEKE